MNELVELVIRKLSDEVEVGRSKERIWRWIIQSVRLSDRAESAAWRVRVGLDEYPFGNSAFNTILHFILSILLFEDVWYNEIVLFCVVSSRGCVC